MEKIEKYDTVFYNSDIKTFWYVEYVSVDYKMAMIRELDTIDNRLWVCIDQLRKAF